MLKTPPNQITAVFRSRQRYVEKPEAFSQAFFLRQGSVRVPFRIKDKVQIPVVRVVESEFFTLLRPVNHPVERAKNNRIFKPLALMDRDDLDSIGIAFEAELVFVKSWGIRVSLPGKPFQKTRHPQLLFRGLLVEHLRKMKNIREPPLPIRQRKQPRPDLLPEHEIPKHPDEAAALP